MAQLTSPPPLWGRVGWGVGRFYANVDARERSSMLTRNLSTPTPAPPHKGEGKSQLAVGVVEATPSGLPTTVTRRPPLRSRLATRRASSSVTLSIIAGRRAM